MIWRRLNFLFWSRLVFLVFFVLSVKFPHGYYEFCSGISSAGWNIDSGVVFYFVVAYSLICLFLQLRGRGQRLFLWDALLCLVGFVFITISKFIDAILTNIFGGTIDAIVGVINGKTDCPQLKIFHYEVGYSFYRIAIISFVVMLAAGIIAFIKKESLKKD